MPLPTQTKTTDQSVTLRKGRQHRAGSAGRWSLRQAGPGIPSHGVDRFLSPIKGIIFLLYCDTVHTLRVSLSL